MNIDCNNATEEEQLKAVRMSGLFIRHFNNPSKEVQLAAVKESGVAFNLIRNPHPDILLYIKMKRKL